MKTLLVLILWVVLGAVATAGDKLLATALVLHVADYQQTLDLKHYPNGYERNIVLGRHPSDNAIHAYFLTTAVAMVGLSRWVRNDYFDWFLVSGSATVVVTNDFSGLRWSHAL